MQYNCEDITDEVAKEDVRGSQLVARVTIFSATVADSQFGAGDPTPTR
jgi:hypothetical protein